MLLGPSATEWLLPEGSCDHWTIARGVSPFKRSGRCTAAEPVAESSWLDKSFSHSMCFLILIYSDHHYISLPWLSDLSDEHPIFLMMINGDPNSASVHMPPLSTTDGNIGSKGAKAVAIAGRFKVAPSKGHGSPGSAWHPIPRPWSTRSTGTWT